MKHNMTCFHCGKDAGTDGVLTVLLSKTANGGIEHVDIRECRPCALEQAKKEGRES